MKRDEQLTEAQEQAEQMTEPEFEVISGEPTERALQAIVTWPSEDVAGCLGFVARGWYGDGNISGTLRPEEQVIVGDEPGYVFLRFVTGGWSGNEAMMRALRRNRLINAQAWCLTARGGLHIYRVPKAK